MMLATAILIAALATEPATTAPVPVSLPAGTQIQFHLMQPLMSDKTKTGQPFSFVLLEPVVVAGAVVVANGAVGSGTVVLSGHNGTSGHEGDLTLRLDTLPAVDGTQLDFCKQQIRINGRNKKVMSAVLGFIPFAGFGARFIRGSEIHIDTATPIETVLLEPASSLDPTCGAQQSCVGAGCGDQLHPDR